MIKLAIFDMDGLMIDSESIDIKIGKTVYKNLGLKFDKQLAYDTIGVNSIKCKELYLKHFGNDFNYDAYTKEYDLQRKKYEANHTYKKKKGLIKLIKYFKKNRIKMAVATSTSKKRATRILKEVGIYNYFDFLVFGDQVEKSKPAPDIYLKTLELGQVTNKEAIVYEDSLNGLLSSHNAKIKCIVIPDICYLPEKQLKKAYRVLNSLDLSIEVIEELNKK